MSLINNSKIIIDSPDSGVIAGAGGNITHTNSFIIGEFPASKADNTLYVNNVETSGNLKVAGIISGNGSGLTNLPTVSEAIGAELFNTVYPTVSSISSTYALSATSGLTSNVATIASLAASSVINSAIGNSIAPIDNPQFTGLQSSLSPLTKVLALKDYVTVSNLPATGTIHIDAISQANVFYTSNATSNWILNIRGNASVSLNSVISQGESISLNFRAAQGSTAFFLSGLTIENTPQTIKWLSKVPILAGHTNGVDLYSFTIVKLGTNSWDVMGSMINFG